jgi:hypothetical protein
MKYRKTLNVHQVCSYPKPSYRYTRGRYSTSVRLTIARFASQKGGTNIFASSGECIVYVYSVQLHYRLDSTGGCRLPAALTWPPDPSDSFVVNRGRPSTRKLDTSRAERRRYRNSFWTLISNHSLSYHVAREQAPGYMDGVLPSSHYYVPKNERLLVRGIFNREYPTSWTQLDVDFKHRTIVDFY